VPRTDPAPDSQRGDLVIRAFVLAKLLGIRLLTLEARVVAGPDNSYRAATPARAIHSTAGPDLPAARPGLPAAWPTAPGQASLPPASGQLARAVALVEQGARTLARIRPDS
jgi:hypothetical protein